MAAVAPPPPYEFLPGVHRPMKYCANRYDCVYCETGEPLPEPVIVSRNDEREVDGCRSVVTILALINLLIFGSFLSLNETRKEFQHHAVCYLPLSINPAVNFTVPCFILSNHSEAVRYFNSVPPHYAIEEIAFNSLFNRDIATLQIVQRDKGAETGIIFDFKTEEMAIVDSKNQRCFVKPLNASTTATPNAFLQYVSNAEFMTAPIKREAEVFNVVLFPLSIKFLDSRRIRTECYTSEIYALESVAPKYHLHYRFHVVTFTHFMGKSLVDYYILNMDEVAAFEKFENFLDM